MIHAAKGDTDSLLKHSFISGRSSHIFWQRKESLTPWLAMLPENGAALEYWDAPKNSPDLYGVFFHAAAEVAAVQAAGSRWRLPATSLTLAPGRQPGEACVSCSWTATPRCAGPSPSMG